jgi:hypothetical protein
VAEQNETAKLWQVEDNPAAEESDENDELRIKWSMIQEKLWFEGF